MPIHQVILMNGLLNERGKSSAEPLVRTLHDLTGRTFLEITLFRHVCQETRAMGSGDKAGVDNPDISGANRCRDSMSGRIIIVPMIEQQDSTPGNLVGTLRDPHSKVWAERFFVDWIAMRSTESRPLVSDLSRLQQRRDKEAGISSGFGRHLAESLGLITPRCNYFNNKSRFVATKFPACIL